MSCFSNYTGDIFTELQYIIEFFHLLAIIIIGIQPLGPFGQRPELSQATGMALVRCVLGKFLGVVCHCFPPAFRCSHFRHQVPPCLPRRERS